MTSNDGIFSGSIPQLYERYLVPLIFESYAVDVARRVSKQRVGDVLEIAAGTGIVTRAMAARLAASVRITATDINQPMLDLAKAKQPDPNRITWQHADALALPFANQSFDAVVCQFGAMFFPDRRKGYAEAKRVLRPGGQFLFNVWGKLSDNIFADTVTESLARLFPNDPPRFLERTPYGHADTDKLFADLTIAGFGSIAIDPVEFKSKAPSARDVAIAYVQGTPLRGEVEARGSLEQATAAAADALARQFGNGPIEGRIKALMITASP